MSASYKPSFSGRLPESNAEFVKPRKATNSEARTRLRPEGAIKTPEYLTPLVYVIAVLVPELIALIVLFVLRNKYGEDQYFRKHVRNGFIIIAIKIVIYAIMIGFIIFSLTAHIQETVVM